MTLTSETYKSFILALAELFEEQKDNLCELDRKIGDGDHGVTMNIGYQAVKVRFITSYKYKMILQKSVLLLVKAFGCSWVICRSFICFRFLKSAVAVKNKTELDDTDLYQFWIAFSKGIKARGKAEIGDKTMIDTLEPFYLSLETSKYQSINFKEAFEIALLEAKRYGKYKGYCFK